MGYQNAMIEVLLDTNIFRTDPSRGKAAFNALMRLAKIGKLRLHIPYFVHAEFVSQETENYEKLINAINQSVTDLQRRHLPRQLTEKLEEIKNKFSEIQFSILSFPETEFSNWINEVSGVVHPISEKHGGLVARDYFDGAPPFRRKKSREDIPDAFIWQVIQDLAHEYESIFVVAADNAIREACKKLLNIQIYSSLDDFISSEVCQVILQEENVKENIEKLYRYLPIILSLRQDKIEIQLKNAFEGTVLQSDLIPNISHSAIIGSIEEVKDEIAIGGVTDHQYFGDGLILLPFGSQIEVSAEYDLPISDFHSLGTKRTERISIYEKDDYKYSAEEDFRLEITGNISIQVDGKRIVAPNLSNQDIRVLIDSATIEIDSISQVKVIDWDPIQNQWEQHFLDLVRYKQENGHCEVPRKHPQLGSWVNNQRGSYQRGKLSRERFKRLNDIGFVWRFRPRGMLDEYIEQLLEYRQIYGHINVPQQDRKYRKLGRWINDQRTNKTRGTLQKEYEDRLNEIGFVWNVPDARWNQRLSELKEYFNKHGHFNVTRDKDFPKLYEWAVKLRRKKPSDERLKQLKAIGYDWDEGSRKVAQTEWNDKLEGLATFYQANGHFNIPYKENKNLCGWLYKLKKRRPSNDRFNSLLSIGYNWDEESKKYRKTKWEVRFDQLKQFYETNGHFNVSSKEDPQLHKWLYKLKYKKPSEEHLQKLQSIGFNWDEETER